MLNFNNKICKKQVYIIILECSAARMLYTRVNKLKFHYSETLQ